MEANCLEPVSVNQIARKLHISVRQLERCFKFHIGSSPRQASIQMRLRIGRQLLSNPDLSVSAIAQEVGFSDSAHFSRAFLKEFGLRPSKHREYSVYHYGEAGGVGNATVARIDSLISI